MPAPLDFQPSPPWLHWFQIGFTSMLLVLFLVILGRSRDQSLELRTLQQRIQVLERNRALEKAANQDGQLQVMAQRLQEIEAREGERLEQADQERQMLRQTILELRAKIQRAAVGPQTPTAYPAVAPLRREIPPKRAPTSLLRPPGQESNGEPEQR
jgi:hypothetical protein